MLKDVSGEVRAPILTANRCYFGLYKHLKSHIVSITTKVQLFKILIRPIIMYGAECRTLCQSDEQNLECGREKSIAKDLWWYVEKQVF
jgi:hypothetical protein